MRLVLELSTESLTRQPLLAVPSTQAWTSAVTVQFIQTGVAEVATLSVAEATTAGWLFQVTVLSNQAAVT